MMDINMKRVLLIQLILIGCTLQINGNVIESNIKDTVDKQTNLNEIEDIPLDHLVEDNQTSQYNNINKNNDEIEEMTSKEEENATVKMTYEDNLQLVQVKIREFYKVVLGLQRQMYELKKEWDAVNGRRR